MTKKQEKLHARRLLRLLSKENPCMGCPVPKLTSLDECLICREFIDIPEEHACPCGILGREEAIKRTWLALEKRGYLE